jgi:hypothetical protein
MALRSQIGGKGLAGAPTCGRKRIELVSSVSRLGADGEIRVGEWQAGADGCLVRFSTIPPEMTIEETEGIVSQPHGRRLRGPRSQSA